MALTNEKIEEFIFYEMNDPKIKINGLRYRYALVGGFNKKGEVYYLDEIAFLGDKVELVREYKSYSKVIYTPDLFGGFLKKEAFERRECNPPDFEDILKFFFKKEIR